MVQILRLHSLFSNIADLIFGYDYFISYRQDDGRNYPNRLEAALTRSGYRVFLDESGYVAGADLSLGTTRRVRMSSYLLLIARQGSMTQSDWVVQEVRACIAGRGVPVVIDVDDAFTKVIGQTEDEQRRARSLTQMLGQRLRIHERSGKTVDERFDGPPSERVLSELRRSFAGTRQEIRRIRFLASTALLLAALSVGAAYAAVQSYRAQKEAEVQRDQAVDTQSRLLAARAVRSTTDGDAQTGILLSMEALRDPSDRTALRPSVEAEKSLLTALYRNPLRSVLRVTGARFVSAGYVHDGSMLTTLDASGKVTFWLSKANGEIGGKVDVSMPSGAFESITLSPSRPVMLLRETGGHYFAWNYVSGKRLAWIDGTCNLPQLVLIKFESSGRKLTVVCGGVSIFDLDTNATMRPPIRTDSVKFSPDGRKALVYSSLHSTSDSPIEMTLLDLVTGGSVSHWRLLDGFLGIQIGFDQKTVLSYDYEGVKFRNSNSGVKTRVDMKTSQSRTLELNVSPREAYFTTDGDDGTRIWDWGRSALVQTLVGGFTSFLADGSIIENDGHSISVERSGVLVGDSYRNFKIWSYETDTHSGARYPIERANLYLEAGHRFVTSSNDNKAVVTISADSAIYVWSINPTMLERSVESGSKLLGHPIQYAENGTVIASASDTGVSIWDPATMTVLNTISTVSPPLQIDISSDGQRLSYFDKDGQYDLLDVPELRSIKPANMPDTAVAVAIAPEGHSVALGLKGRITIRRIVDGSLVRDCLTPDDVTNVGWSSEEEIAYTTMAGKTALVQMTTCNTVAHPVLPSVDGSTSDPTVLRSRWAYVFAPGSPTRLWSVSRNLQLPPIVPIGWNANDKFLPVDILPNDRVIGYKHDGDPDFHVIDLASNDEVVDFRANTADCCQWSDAVVSGLGDRLMTSWRYRSGRYRLDIWRLFPSLDSAVEFARQAVPECLSMQRRQALGLTSEPPVWCILMRKHPYNTPEWREWAAQSRQENRRQLPSH